jgi:UDP-N-acetyl-D-glucosamine dehydrogenase
MLTELATHMEPAVSVAPDAATVAVLGLGYVGLPVALTCAEAGFQVVGIDSNPERVRVLRDAAVDGPEVLPLSGALRGGNLAVTHDPASLGRADAVFICVPTPLEEGEARHEAVRACAAAFARHGRPDALVILESTVRPGFVDELRALLGHGGRVALAYAPERIDPQRSQEGMPLREIPRLVAGVDDGAQARAAALLRAMGVTVHPVPLRVAEYAKLLENADRLLNVAFIDQFAALCRSDGIDPCAVIRAAPTKPDGFQTVWPGDGAVGHCVAVDPGFLTHRSRAKGQPLALLEGALDANPRRSRLTAAAVAADTAPDEAELASRLSYKAGVANIRESSVPATARALAGMNRRALPFAPTVATPTDLEPVSLAEGLRRARAAVLHVPQPEPIIQALAAAGITLFDAPGTLPGAVGV